MGTSYTLAFGHCSLRNKYSQSRAPWRVRQLFFVFLLFHRSLVSATRPLCLFYHTLLLVPWALYKMFFLSFILSQTCRITKTYSTQLLFYMSLNCSSYFFHFSTHDLPELSHLTSQSWTASSYPVAATFQWLVFPCTCIIVSSKFSRLYLWFCFQQPS